VPKIAVSGGLELEYEELGPPDGPVILLVMGLGMQLVAWPDALCESLAAKGFRVVRFDNRDIGLSTHLDHLGFPDIGRQAIRYFLHLPLKSPYFIADMARDTLGFMDAMGLQRAHVMGASMGGMIAQDLAALAPERVASLVSVMSTTGSRKLPGPKARALQAMLLPPAPEGDVEAATKRLMQLFRIIGSRTYPADEGYLREWCGRHVRRSYHPAGGTRQLLAIAASGDRTEVVKRIKAPTLVLHGDEDPLLRPACGEATARAIREGGGSAELEIIRGMGHDFPVELMPGLAERVAQFCLYRSQ
jgi:pimeloyl-ACP methyl ester carboxylesterase